MAAAPPGGDFFRADASALPMQDAIPRSPHGPTIPPEEWVRGYFAGVDTLEPDAVTRHFAPDGRFRFGNDSPAVGHAAITAMLEKFYGQLAAMRHENTGLWTGEDSAVFEAVARPTSGSSPCRPSACCASTARATSPTSAW